MYIRDRLCGVGDAKGIRKPESTEPSQIRNVFDSDLAMFGLVSAHPRAAGPEVKDLGWRIEGAIQGATQRMTALLPTSLVSGE